MRLWSSTLRAGAAWSTRSTEVGEVVGWPANSQIHAADVSGTTASSWSPARIVESHASAESHARPSPNLDRPAISMQFYRSKNARRTKYCFNERNIAEFRSNDDKVGGQLEGCPPLILTVTASKR
jgi:hypothetical protein